MKSSIIGLCILITCFGVNAQTKQEIDANAAKDQLMHSVQLLKVQLGAAEANFNSSCVSVGVRPAVCSCIFRSMPMNFFANDALWKDSSLQDADDWSRYAKVMTLSKEDAIKIAESRGTFDVTVRPMIRAFAVRDACVKM